MTTIRGLSESEVLARRARGQGNNVRVQTGRTYADILRDNLLTFVNFVLFGIGTVMVLLRLYSDALLSVGLVLMNVVVGVAQEIRAKRKLDRIALLTRPKATVIREGQEKTVDPSEIVLGDVLVVGPGDQILVDGQVIGEGHVDVDESLLTGESDLVPKRTGDTVLSGSFAVNGRACYEAQKVGADSYANRLTTSARAFRQELTPLQRDTNLVIRLLILVVGFFGLLLVIAVIIEGTPLTESVKMAAVVAGLIPNGLFFMITVAYAMGAVRMAGRGALIQQANAVESLSNVDVLCMDKTGTLTANRIRLRDVHPCKGLDRADLERLLGDFAASASGGNRTSEAVQAALGGQKRPLREEVPFSSERKWSALCFDTDDLRGVYVLGAPEMLRPHVDWPGADLDRQIAEWADAGLRVLLFASRPDPAPLHDGDAPRLPDGLIPLGTLVFEDELRAEAEAAIRGFAQAGIRLKVISGDNPHTVAALAKQAGLDGSAQAVSGLELDGMDEAQFAQAAADATIFGRITPQQKERLVDALRQRGHYVAMIGDGVNDVLSLKKANLGIAMQSGSQATRGVADIVLLNDSFGALPTAFSEGQRIVNGMQDIFRLFLTRVGYVALLIMSVAVIELGFPFTPKHGTLLTLLTVGIPTLLLAAWSRPGPARRRSLIRSVIRFVLPASVTIALAALAVYLLFFFWNYFPSGGAAEAQAAWDAAQDAARSALTTATILMGLLLLPFVEPPTPFWTGGDALSGDRRPSVMAVLMLVLFVAVLAVPELRAFFEIRLLRAVDYAIIVGVALAWAAALRFIWRRRLLDRFLGVDLG